MLQHRCYNTIFGGVKTIEQEILQSRPFPNAQVRALVNLIFTSNMISDKMNDSLKLFELTNQQYNVLRIVNGAEEEVSTAYIRKRMLVKNCDSSRLVDRLISKELLVKKRSNKDARLVSIRLTSEGKKMLEEVKKSIHSSKNPIISLPDIESEQLNYLLDKIRNLNT